MEPDPGNGRLPSLSLFKSAGERTSRACLHSPCARHLDQILILPGIRLIPSSNKKMGLSFKEIKNGHVPMVLANSQS